MDLPAYEFNRLRSSANANQSFRDASFIDQGKTDGFTHRTSLPTRSRTHPADWESERREIIKARCSGESSATHAQMPALRSSLCSPGSSRPASFGVARAEEEGGVISFPFSPPH